jgi:alpha-D-xyloside xylohydrolase
LDNIVLDWQYWKTDQWGSHEFDKDRFPDPAGMISTLHQKYNAQLMISVWPKFYTSTENYKIMNEKGFLYTGNVKNNQKDWIGYVSTFYDVFNPDARKLFWSMINDKLYKLGVDGWWLDATEPDMLSNISVNDRKLLMKPTYVKSPSRYFNTYAVLNAQGVYEGQRSVNNNQRVFILTRSAYAGLQRYAAATWSGDVASRWEDLKLQIPAGLNFSLAGMPYWTTDIGGFAVERRYENPSPADLDEWRELQTRWFQFGTFCPLFRVHGQYPYREMFNIAPENHEVYKTLVWFDNLRYRLMPYIYSLSAETYFNDYTIMRGLIMDFESDRNVWNIDNQFMFGPGLLINPVTGYKVRTREVYLPQNTGWYDLYTGKYLNGGQTIMADAPVSKIPVFAKEGAIIPMGPAIQYCSQKTSEPFTIVIYSGKNGSFNLYEDEGTNYNYEKGDFTIIPFIYNQNTGTLSIGKRTGKFNGMLMDRKFRIVFIGKDKPVAFENYNNNGILVNYSGDEIQVKMN